MVRPNVEAAVDVRHHGCSSSRDSRLDVEKRRSFKDEREVSWSERDEWCATQDLPDEDPEVYFPSRSLHSS
jgi:hypothetical protein